MKKVRSFSDELTRFVRDVCLVLMSIFIGTVLWFMWDRMTGPAELKKQNHMQDHDNNQNQMESIDSVQNQMEIRTSWRTSTASRTSRRTPSTCTRTATSRGIGEYGSPEEVEARLNAWMREEIIQKLRRGEEEERGQREEQRQRELDRQREEIMAE